MHVDFPYGFDGRERTAVVDDAGHVRDLIEQVIFTSPGERVNRPDFGSGVLQLLFGPASAEASATAEFLIRGSLQQHLGRRIQLEDVTTEAEEATVRITIVYRLVATGERRSDTFERGAAP